MILTFQVPRLASGKGLCDIKKVKFRVTQKKISKRIVKSSYGGVKPIISQMGKLELLIQFRRDRTSQFFETFRNNSELQL